MTHEEKIAIYLATLAEDHPPRGVSAIWQVMWGLGIKIPPPEFIPPLAHIGLIASVLFFFLGVPVILIGFQDKGPSLAVFVYPAMVSFFAAGIATYFVMSSRDRHGFDSWSDFGDSHASFSDFVASQSTPASGLEKAKKVSRKMRWVWNIVFVSYAVLALARLWLSSSHDGSPNADGFDPRAYAKSFTTPVSVLAVQPDGKILVGGDFTSIAGASLVRLARLRPDGRDDASFANSKPDGEVETIALQADGRIVIGGEFTHMGDLTRSHIARLNADGRVDSTFDPNADDSVRALAVQADGRIVVGGKFTRLNGSAKHNRIARLNADGSLDSTFVPRVEYDHDSLIDPSVYALVIQADGKILLGSGFYCGHGRATLCGPMTRLNADGSVDGAFVSDDHFTGDVYALALQADGKILLGGSFTGFTNNIARLNADGRLDRAFNAHTDEHVNALAVQADGKILLGGLFSKLNGSTTRNRIARLNADGSVDLSFDPNTGEHAHVNALAVQADGKILLGGGFDSLAGGTVVRKNIARLNADGSVDREVQHSN